MLAKPLIEMNYPVQEYNANLKDWDDFYKIVRDGLWEVS